MKLGPTARTLAALALVAVLAIALGYTFRAYQNPIYVAQWLSVLQLCR
jgi:hypothetical protein